MRSESAIPRLGILYGGTFDPVHNGHIAVAQHVRDVLDAEVRLMPAADPPHRGPTRASAAQRADMLQLAIAGEARLQLDRRELRRDGPSFTVDTLRALRAQVGPDAPWAIVVGADSFRSLDRWHLWRELFALAHLIVAEREGNSIARDLPEAVEQLVSARWTRDPRALHNSAAGRVFALQQPLFPHSASEVRRRIAAGEPWRDWVAPAVADYIERHGLYQPEH